MGIRLDFTNTSAQHVSEEHGLDFVKSFAEYKDKIAGIVKEIYAKKDTPGNWLGWMNSTYDEALIKDIKEYAANIKDQFMDVLVMGIGGSSLGGQAVSEALLKPYWNNTHNPRRNGYPRIFFLDNIDPDQVNAMLEVIILHKSLINIITKSGTTAETMATYSIFKNKLQTRLGDEYKKHLVFTTDSKKGALREIAQKEGIKAFDIPSDVGGRFSVFSAVGLLPLALMGVDIDKILAGIRDMDKIVSNGNIEENPAAQAALINYLLDQKGKKINVLMPYSYKLRYVSDWYVQLWAESLGKKVNLNGETVHSGTTPVKALGAVDQHSQVQLYNEGPNDKLITFIRVDNFDNTIEIPDEYYGMESVSYLSGKTLNSLIHAEAEATAKALTNAQRPNMTFYVPQVDEYHVGQLLYLLEMQTAIAGALYHINPFDQPGVEMGKNYTYGLMGRGGYEKYAKELSLV